MVFNIYNSYPSGEQGPKSHVLGRQRVVITNHIRLIVAFF